MDDLPDEICLEFLKYFPPRRLITELSFVSKRWRKLALSPTLWHNVELNIDDLADCQAELHSFLSQIAVGPRRLSLSTRESVRPAIFSSLPRLPNVVWLNFAFVDGLDDTSVVILLVENCPSVEEANLEGCKELNDASLAVISGGWRNLRRLNISHCTSVTNSGLNSLFNSAIRLESINIDGIKQISDVTVDILAVRHGDSLQSVWLDGEGLSDLAILSLSCNCTRLREISISFATGLTNGSTEYLKRLDCISHLHVKKGRRPWMTGLFSRQFAQLQFLSLHDWRGLCDVGVAKLTTSCPLLRSVCLAFCPYVSDWGVELLVERCRNLSILSLIGMYVTGDVFSTVPHANLPQLKFLNLSRSHSVEFVLDGILDDLLIRSDQLVVVKSNGETFKGVGGEIAPLSHLVTKNLLKSLDGGQYCLTTGF